MFRDHDASNGQGNGAGADGNGGQAENEQRKAFALQRYFVFTAEQIEGMPKVKEPVSLSFNPIEKAETVIDAMKQQTGLMVIHRGDRACYVPIRTLRRLDGMKTESAIEFL